MASRKRRVARKCNLPVQSGTGNTRCSSGSRLNSLPTPTEALTGHGHNTINLAASTAASRRLLVGFASLCEKRALSRAESGGDKRALGQQQVGWKARAGQQVAAITCLQRLPLGWPSASPSSPRQPNTGRLYDRWRIQSSISVSLGGKS